MKRVIGVAALMLGLSAAPAAAQEGAGNPSGSRSRFSLEAAAGLQMRYDGTAQSVAFGFAPTRGLTLLLSAEQSHVSDKFQRFEKGFSRERGGTEQFVSVELRYTFLPGKRVSPYVLGGVGRGIARPNVSQFFPNQVERDIRLLHYGAGVRIPVHSRLDAFVDTRIVGFVDDGEGIGVRFPVRAGIAWRF